MATPNKVIITCAVTGSIHTPTMSPHLPITSQEIADAAIGAVEAGAAVVHLHARDPKDGRPDQSPEAFAPFLKVIKQRSGAIVNITTGGAPTMTIEERVRPAATFKPEVASLNMGSMNFGLFPMLARYKEFQHEWEKPYLEGIARAHLQEHIRRHRIHPRRPAPRTARVSRSSATTSATSTRSRTSSNAAWSSRRSSSSRCSAFSAASAPHPEDVIHMRRTADRLFGRELSLVGAGRRPQPDADRRHVGRDGRQRAGRP